MKVRNLQRSSRVFLTPAEYQRLLDSAPHERARLAIRLMGHSLRVSAVAEEVRMDRFDTDYTCHGPIHYVTVPSKDTSDRNHGKRNREVYISDSLFTDIKEYHGTDTIDTATPVIRKSKRAIQNWIKTTRENAATATGNKDYLKVSSHDFRRYFATQMVHRHKLRPSLVAQMGGWRSVEAMKEYLIAPSDVVADALGQDLMGADLDRTTPDGEPYRRKSAIESLSDRIDECDDHHELAALAQSIAEQFRGTDIGIEVIGSVNSPDYSDQKSLEDSLD